MMKWVLSFSISGKFNFTEDAESVTFAHRPGVEAVVDEMLQILAHADLAHEAVPVAVHARELPDLRQRRRRVDGVAVAS